MQLVTRIVERPGPHRPGMWAGFLVPEAVVDSIAPGSSRSRRRVPVVVELGGYRYRSSLTRRDDGWEFIASLEFRRRTGTSVGDTVHVDITHDVAERTVELPDDVTRALNQADLAEWFGRLPYSHRRELMLYVDDAKRPETRSRRIAAIVQRGRSQE